MPKNEILPKIYQTRQKIKHTCLKSGPYMPQMVHPYLLHNVCIAGTQDLDSETTRSGFWTNKIRILKTQDLYSGHTRSAI